MLSAPRPRREFPSSIGSALPLSLLAACAFSAGIHVALAPDHLGESTALGLSFLVAAALLLALGLGTFARPRSMRLPLLIALLSAALIAAYIASRSAGLPILHPEPEPVDAVGVTTKAVELVALTLSLHLYRKNAVGHARCETKRRTRWTTIPWSEGAGF
jgi:hypothetical protein